MMIKNKKANPKGGEKSNKVVKKVAVANPKNKKQQLEKVKKSIKEKLVETPKDEVEEQQISSEDEILEDAPDASEAESQNEEEENSETEDAAEQSEDQSDDAAEQSEDQDEDAAEQSEDAAEQSEDQTEKEPECTEGVGNTILIIKVPAGTTRSQLVSLFAPCGKIMSIICTVETNAFVVFDSSEAATNALKLRGTELNDDKLFIIKPLEGQKFPFPRPSNSHNTVHISNLNPKSKEIEIKKLFYGCGTVAYANILKSRDGSNMGFVCFRDSPGAIESALKINGTILDDNPIKVERYLPQIKSKSSLFNKTGFNPRYPKFKKNTQFRGVKSGGIKKLKEKAPKKINKIAAKE